MYGMGRAAEILGARDLVDQGIALEAACRIIILEDQAGGSCGRSVWPHLRRVPA
ncbi:hypothetical protein [Actinomadura nitritigenes]|uniref:hypothetical protein n=1 Tax=Actinomadura nitritigenes TaxID=134602 RepID=UPI003D91DBCD